MTTPTVPVSVCVTLLGGWGLQNNREKASSAGLRKPYLRVVGIEVDSDGPGRASGRPLTSEEEEEFRRLSSRPDIYDIVARCNLLHRVCWDVAALLPTGPYHLQYMAVWT